jgi:hypothetical protein
MLFHSDLARCSSSENMKLLSSCFILTARAASCAVSGSTAAFRSLTPPRRPPSAAVSSKGVGFLSSGKKLRVFWVCGMTLRLRGVAFSSSVFLLLLSFLLFSFF